MIVFNRLPPPRLHLYRLTLQIRGRILNAYSMGESVKDSFGRYIERAIKQKETAADIELLQGDLADPNAEARP